jgi:hypothetical protein
VPELFGVVQGSVKDILVLGGSGLRVLRLLGYRGDEVVVDARPGEHAGGGGAVLPGVEVAADSNSLCRCLQIGVVEDDDRGLAA